METNQMSEMQLTPKFPTVYSVYFKSYPEPGNFQMHFINM